MPRRSQVIGRMVEDGALALQQHGLARLGERQRQQGEHLFELRSLRGKSAARLQLMSRRLEGEAADFERCAPKLSALRAVLMRQQQAALDHLSSDRLRELLREMRQASQGKMFKLGAAKAFSRLGDQMQACMTSAGDGLDELQEMLRASVQPLNAEYGLALDVPMRPSLDAFVRELDRVREGYSRYVGVTQLWRLAQPDFMDRFCRLLHSRMRVVFEGAAHEVELWTQAICAQIDTQMRDRRQALVQRREAHGRIRQAEDGLERSIANLESLQAQCDRLAEQLAEDVDRLRHLAASPPAPNANGAAARSMHLQLVQPAVSAA
jgi:chromosome segregation ATPase